MKIFNDQKSWNSKVNFVDDNNVFVGYDMAQNCCEYADWFIADQPQEKIPDPLPICEEELPGWNFDPDWFRQSNIYAEYDQGGVVIFRLIKDGAEKFLHLFNCHNGYYSHGFRFGKGDVIEKNDYI